MRLIKKYVISAVAALTLVPLAGAPHAYAALSATSVLSQSITAGTISTDIRNASNVIINNPTIAMAAITASTAQQTATGTFGSNAQRITVDNPGGANNGWTLSLNATNPATDVWTSGGNNYDFNAASAAGGQLTVNPTTGTTTASVGGTTGITMGTSATFNSTAAVALVNAAAASADIWNGYFTGISLSQTIPAGQPVGTYTLPMTQTLTTL